MITVDRAILTIFALMFVVGAADYIFGGKCGFGKKFVEGLQTFAPLFITMSGFLVLTPLLVKVCGPAITPLLSAAGIDPGIFPGIILACDSGAYPLAQELCRDPQAAGFGGILLASVFGANVICIPLALQLLDGEDQKIFFKGMVIGIITIPVGLIAGGLTAGYDMIFICRQLPLPALLSAVLTVMYFTIPVILVKTVACFARCMQFIAISGMSVAVFFYLSSGKDLKYFAPLGDAVNVIGSIAVVLPGVYVFTEVFSRIMKKPFSVLGKSLKINDFSVAGFLATAANSIPTFALMKSMDEKGKFINSAFIVSGAFMLGDHLAFCGAVVPELLVPMMVTKFTAASAAAVVAMLLYSRSFRHD